MENNQSLRNRYITTPTSGLTVLKLMRGILDGDSRSMMHRLIETTNERLSENPTNLEILNDLRTLLVCEFQWLQEYPDEQRNPNFIGTHVVRHLLESFHIHFDIEDEVLRGTIFDIIILQLTLHADVGSIICCFDNFYKSAETNSNLKVLIGVSECLTDALNLSLTIKDKVVASEDERTKICDLLLLKIGSWFTHVECTDFRNFVSLISKTLVTCNSITVISKLWELILTHTDTYKSLTLLCTLADDFFFLESEKEIMINLKNINDERFLRIIKLGLTSTVQQHRKQAQHILKRIIELTSTQEYTTDTSNKTSIPAIYEFISKDPKIDFPMLLESLEEKQAHLVLPAMSRFEMLITTNDYLNHTWLKVLFQRIFGHENNSVIKSGLLIMLKMNPTFFDGEFLLLLVNVLNNTFLYDEPNSEPKPEVTKALTGFFSTAENEKIGLINSFIVAASTIEIWAPVPIFWLLEALRGLQGKGIECNSWNQGELEALTTIVDNSVIKQSEELRGITLSSLSKCFSIYAGQTIDLSLLSRTFLCNDYYHEGRGRDLEFLEYMKKHIPEDDAVQYVLDACDRLMYSENQIHIDSFAKIIVLLWRRRKILSSESCPTKSALSKVFEVFIGIDMRPYADIPLCERALELLGHLTEKCYDETIDSFGSSGKKYIDGALKFISKSLERSKCPKTYEQVSIYMNKIGRMFGTRSFHDLTDDILKLHQKSIETLKSCEVQDIQFWYAAGILYETGKSFEVQRKFFNENYANFLLDLCEKSINSSNANKEAARHISGYHGIMSKLIDQLFSQFRFTKDSEMKKFLSIMMTLVETGSDHVIPSVPGTLLAMMKEKDLLNDEICSTIKITVDLVWKRIWSMKRIKLFWSSVENIVVLITNDRFFEFDALNYVDELLEKSENLPKLRLILLNALDNLEPQSKFKFRNAVLSCFLHVNVGRIDKRIERQIFRYACEDYSMVRHPPEILTHSRAIINILSMTSWNSGAVSASYIPVLLSLLEKQKNKRYFANSNVHILKNRIMQILLILQPEFDKQNALKVHDTIYQLLLEESNQPSVRIMQEWLLVRIYNKTPELQNQLWGAFTRAREGRPGSITSIASIVYHVLKLLPTNEKYNCFREAVNNILPNCMTQQFVVRLYCQVILSKLFEIARDESWTLPFELEVIEASLKISLRQGNLLKNSIKLLEDFYFTMFDPMQDHDIRTIFYDLPRLLNVSMDECINLTILESSSWNGTVQMPYSNREKLSSIQTPSPPQGKTIESNGIIDNCDSLTTDDIQKKMMPSKSLDLSDEKSLMMSTFKQQMLENDSGMIVIASLIDSFPNLGGLARTCEIFCAREFVLGSLKYADNKEFQSLSVSSEKWILMSEVKPHELRNYLLEKKTLGWSLVGAEQTANSVNLQDIEFPKKTILLLGNEKNGIPANLIPLMDMCVEIPQAGVVRSLNVHVTGAICLWHYAKAHIFKGPIPSNGG